MYFLQYCTYANRLHFPILLAWTATFFWTICPFIVAWSRIGKWSKYDWLVCTRPKKVRLDIKSRLEYVHLALHCELRMSALIFFDSKSESAIIEPRAWALDNYSFMGYNFLSNSIHGFSFFFNEDESVDWIESVVCILSTKLFLRKPGSTRG